MATSTLRQQIDDSLKVVPPKAINPATGCLWTAAEWAKAMGAVRAEALSMRGTGDLPNDAGRDPQTGLWNNAPRG